MATGAQLQNVARTRSHAACSCRPRGARTVARAFNLNIFAKQGVASQNQQFGSLKVSQIGLGTWSWGNKVLWGYDESMDEELQEAFNLASAQGVNLWDTGDSYGVGALNGRAEQLLGRFAAASGQASSTVVATKLAAYPWRVTPESMVSACEGSLRRTGLSQMPLVQLHWSTENYQPLQERAQWEGLARIYERGLAKEVGVSNFGPRQLEKIHRRLSEERGVPIASAQVQFSLLSYGALQRDVVDTCRGLGIGVIAYSPLGLGMLTGAYDVERGWLPPGLRGQLFRQVLPKVRPVTETLGAIARERGRDPAQVAVNWCMRKGTVPIPGAKSVKQVRANLGACGWALNAAEVEELDAAVGRCTGGMVQNIFSTK